MEQDEPESTCHLCGEAHYVTTQDDKYCPHCFYSPEPRTARPKRSNKDEWQHFWHRREIARQLGKRPYCVGGFKSAYQGTGTYEYDFDTGRFIQPRVWP